MADPAYRFDFYERVRVVSGQPELASIRGQIAAVMGRAQQAEEPSYAVSVYATEETWSVSESDLEPTGEHDERESFYSGKSVPVRVDASGAGRIA